MATAGTAAAMMTDEELVTRELARVQTLRGKLVVQHPFWASLLLPMRVEIARGIPTFAATDCVKRIWLNPDWTRHLNLKQLGYVLVHEVCHVAFLHGLRREKRDLHRWNRAADYASNAVIEELTYVGLNKETTKLYERPDLVIPGYGRFRPCYRSDFKGLTAEEIYDRLEAPAPDDCPTCGTAHEKPRSPQDRQTPVVPHPSRRPQPGNGASSPSPAASGSPPRSGSQDGNGASGHQGCDRPQRTRPDSGDGLTDAQWPSAGTGNGDGDSQPGDGGPTENDPSTAGDAPPSFDGHCEPGTTCLQVPPRLTERQVQDLIDTVVGAFATWQTSNQKGSMPAGLHRFLKRLAEAKVPWQRVLQQYAGAALTKEDYSLSPPHRRWLPHDIIRPSLRSERLGQLVINIDTSGSTQPYVEEFAAEMAKLYTYCEETLILTSDASIQQVVKTSEVPEFLRRLDFQGGGGTSHIPVFTWLREHRVYPDLLVALTDLASDFPEQKPPFPVVWCVKEGHAAGPGWGRIVVIPEKPETLARQ